MSEGTSGVFELHIMSDTIYYIMDMVVHHTLFFKRAALQDFYRTCCRSMNSSFHVHVKRAARFSVTFAAISCLFMFAAYATSYYLEGRSTFAVLMRALDRSYYVGDWPTRIAIHYVLLLRCLHFVHLSYYEQLRARITNSAKCRLNYNQELLLLRNVKQLKALFDELLGIIPVAWSIITLVTVTGFLFLAERYSNIAILVKESAYMLRLAAVSFAVLYYPIKHHNVCFEMASTLTDAILVHDTQSSSTKVMFIHELSQQNYLTGWKLFDIRPSLLLSIVGSFISFTIMFLELARENK